MCVCVCVCTDVYTLSIHSSTFLHASTSCRVYTIHCVLEYTLYIVYWSIHNTLCIGVYIIHCVLEYTLYIVYWSIHYTLCIGVYIIHCVLEYTLYIVYWSIHYTLYKCIVVTGVQNTLSKLSQLSVYVACRRRHYV